MKEVEAIAAELNTSIHNFEIAPHVIQADEEEEDDKDSVYEDAHEDNEPQPVAPQPQAACHHIQSHNLRLIS